MNERPMYLLQSINSRCSIYLKFGLGDPWAGQESDSDPWDWEVISESLDNRVTFGAEPPIGSYQKIKLICNTNFIWERKPLRWELFWSR